MRRIRKIWVLGAPDPEMEAIEALLRERGETVAYATRPDGKRVHAGNAYLAGAVAPGLTDQPIPERPSGRGEKP